ncbi:MAG: EamA family transporter [Hyphomonadaceae bacterium]|nr:EamA family transporter [Clostridia bacterium]
MTLYYFLLIVVTEVLLVAGQIFWKLGMKANPFNMSLILQPYILIGFGIYGIATVIWMFVLSKVDVSIAYPLNSMGYVFLLFAAWLVLGEEITVPKIVGIIVITIGIVILAMDASSVEKFIRLFSRR